MKNKVFLFSRLREKNFCQGAIKLFDEASPIASTVLDVLRYDRKLMTYSDIKLLKKLIQYAMCFVDDRPECLNEILLSNSDCEIYSHLKCAFENDSEFLSNDYFTGVFKLSRYSILALLHQKKYGLITATTINMLKAIYPDEFECRVLESSDYDIANSLLVEEFEVAGFCSAAEFSLHLIELYRFSYRYIRPVRGRGLTRLALAEKLEKFSAGNYKGGDNYSPSIR